VLVLRIRVVKRMLVGTRAGSCTQSLADRDRHNKLNADVSSRIDPLQRAQRLLFRRESSTAE